MANARFTCNAVEVFDVYALRDWIRTRQAEGSIAVGEAVALEVRHPDREMDGSCRWCGCRENEVVRFEAAELAG